MCSSKKQICIGVLVMVAIIATGASILAGFDTLVPQYNFCVLSTMKNVTCQATCSGGDCTLTYGALTYDCTGCSYNKTVACAHLPYGDGLDCVKKDETKAIISPDIYDNNLIIGNLIIPNVVIGLVLFFSLIYIIASIVCCCKLKNKKNKHGDDIELLDK